MLLSANRHWGVSLLVPRSDVLTKISRNSEEAKFLALNESQADWPGKLSVGVTRRLEDSKSGIAESPKSTGTVHYSGLSSDKTAGSPYCGCTVPSAFSKNLVVAVAHTRADSFHARVAFVAPSLVYVA